MKIEVLELVGKLLERYESQHERVDNYFGLLAYYGLAQAAVVGERKDYLTKCIDYLRLYPDNFLHPYYNFESYRVGGNGKAWLFFKGLFPQAEEDIRKYAEITMDSPKGENGILCRPSKREHIWIDVVTCTTPFMLYAGLALGEERYVDFAAEQCFKMYELFLDQTCGLLHQAKGFMENPKQMSEDHWSRGNGWGLIGLAELVRYLPQDSKHRPKAEEYFKDLMEAVLPYQSARGLWRQEMTRDYAWEESSGSALILYGMGIGMRLGLLSEEVYRPVFEKGISALGEYCLCEDFSTYRSCPGCLCPGNGLQKGSISAYLTEKIPMKDEVHSFGCMMLALVEAYRNGIPEIEILGKIR